MTEHALAVAALVIAAAGFGIDAIALWFLVGIWRDDRLMRIAAEGSLKAQLEYLGLRRKWYENRTKKKDNAQVAAPQPGSEDGPVANVV